MDKEVAADGSGNCLAAPLSFFRGIDGYVCVGREWGMKKTIVLGLGNLLFSDEGIGVHAVQRLWQDYDFDDTVEVIDGGTLGLLLLEHVEEAERLLCIDAIASGREPGTLVRLEGEAIPAYLGVKMSQHQMGFQEVLGLARLRGTLPEAMVMVGIEPSSLEWGTSLTGTVEATMPRLVTAVIEQLQAWGVPPRRKGIDHA
ncbi:HyaD/HybD family hydrogenase maturation endopeptidase [Heliophilum fasciatum]|uniref:Hydrogenase maturation protease n=1 Tax=Heliophilum fasciatum TaxID=35700 RepID=A0A4R2RI22_9FIRM|nr:HyaD/HybD family hydrogenase maturation endopeptidase [Heliophilum fasciatum]TCP61797.1 hydrogenase maturation protease [Heliophilum fasciatum]